MPSIPRAEDIKSAKSIRSTGSKVTCTSFMLCTFRRSEKCVQEEWDQNKFLDLLASWIVACDQPFEEVDRPEFQDLLKYVRHSRASFTIPGRNAIRRRIMKLGEVELAATKEMFSVSSYLLFSTSFNPAKFVMSDVERAHQHFP